MIVLGLDTATPQVGVALAGPDGPLASFHAAGSHRRGGRRHGELLAPAIAWLCRDVGVALGDVDLVAVDVGPGLFTGLRVGVATAKALASALGIPVVGLTSLEVLAHPHRRTDRLVAAVVDARRAEVFWALFRPVTCDGRVGMARLTEPAVSPPEKLAAEVDQLGVDVLAVGDGARRYADLLSGLARVEVAGPEDAYPSAAVLVDLAGGAPRSAAAELMPRYLRPADVRIGWAQHDGRGGQGDRSAQPERRPVSEEVGHA